MGFWLNDRSKRQPSAQWSLLAAGSTTDHGLYRCARGDPATHLSLEGSRYRMGVQVSVGLVACSRLCKCHSVLCWHLVRITRRSCLPCQSSSCQVRDDKTGALQHFSGITRTTRDQLSPARPVGERAARSWIGSKLQASRRGSR
jgi:hypothetical protein